MLQDPLGLVQVVCTLEHAFGGQVEGGHLAARSLPGPKPVLELKVSGRKPHAPQVCAWGDIALILA